jgi:hypothetical protein
MQNLDTKSASRPASWSEGESQRWMRSRQLATYADKHKGLAEFLNYEGIIFFKGKRFFV